MKWLLAFAAIALSLPLTAGYEYPALTQADVNTKTRVQNSKYTETQVSKFTRTNTPGKGSETFTCTATATTTIDPKVTPTVTPKGG